VIDSIHEGIIFASKLLRIRTNRRISRRLELHNAYDNNTYTSATTNGMIEGGNGSINHSSQSLNRMSGMNHTPSCFSVDCVELLQIMVHLIE